MKFTFPINHGTERASYEAYYDFLNANKTKRCYIMIAIGLALLISTLFIHNPSLREKLFVFGTMLFVGYIFILIYYTNHKKKILS